MLNKVISVTNVQNIRREGYLYIKNIPGLERDLCLKSVGDTGFERGEIKIRIVNFIVWVRGLILVEFLLLFWLHVWILYRLHAQKNAHFQPTMSNNNGNKKHCTRASVTGSCPTTDSGFVHVQLEVRLV